jgi:hypothetical protein
MKLTATVVLTTTAGLVLMGASECGTTKEQSCKITARDVATITTKCGTHDAPGDLYPKCQVGQWWPSCKEK